MPCSIHIGINCAPLPFYCVWPAGTVFYMEEKQNIWSFLPVSVEVSLHTDKLFTAENNPTHQMIIVS